MTYWDARAGAERAAAEPLWNSYAQRFYDVRPASYLNGQWEARNWLNVPGPFYGAFTDTCGAGPPAAPLNVSCDDDGTEFVWRQPRCPAEVRAVLGAAYQEPFDGYNWDGDDRWTPELVMEWWDGRARVDEWLSTADFGQSELASKTAGEYRRYLAGELRDDLLRYAEWLSQT